MKNLKVENNKWVSKSQNQNVTYNFIKESNYLVITGFPYNYFDVIQS